LAMAAFVPCYIGGWSAAEHWGLTEQLFRETFVVTGAHVRAIRKSIGGVTFRLARVAAKRAVGDATVWRGTARASCSTPELTLVDGAARPSWLGGVRHLTETLARYAESPSPNLTNLSAHLKRLGRGA